MAAKIEPEKMYNLKELGVYLPITPDTVRAWIRTGKIKAVKIGRLWYVKGAELIRILDKGL